jgi:hypothetical protein
MTNIYALPDGRILQAGVAFTLGEVQYPPNWLELSTADDRALLGITVTAPEPAPDPMTTPASQAELLDHLADLRWDAERAGVNHQGIVLPTDRERRSALKDAADKMRDGTLTSPTAVAFSAAVYATVTLEQLDAAVGAITIYVQKVFSDAAGVAVMVINGTLTTRAQVQAAWEVARTP